MPLGDPGYHANLVSCSAPHAGDWLHNIPYSVSLSIHSIAFRMLSRIRLGLPPVTNMPQCCICGASLLNDPSHFLSYFTMNQLVDLLISLPHITLLVYVSICNPTWPLRKLWVPPIEGNKRNIVNTIKSHRPSPHASSHLSWIIWRPRQWSCPNAEYACSSSFISAVYGWSCSLQIIGCSSIPPRLD